MTELKSTNITGDFDILLSVINQQTKTNKDTDLDTTVHIPGKQFGITCKMIAMQTRNLRFWAQTAEMLQLACAMTQIQNHVSQRRRCQRH